jgi:carboxypeptidase Q
MPRIFLVLSLALASALPLHIFAQALAPQSPQARIAQMLNESPGVWTPAQIANMERLRDAALSDPYALTKLRHLTDNIGPRLAGSPQAQHAVEWVAEEMRALGATVTIEKTTVPHWIRGEETAELTAWPGMTPKTTQKVRLTTLGGSVATQKDGITAPVIVVDSFAALKALPKDAVKGKILLFNERFDKELAAQGRGDEAYGEAVIYRGAAPSVAASLGAVATLVRSVGGADYRLPHTGMTYYSPGMPKIPAAAVTAEDSDLLKNLTQQGEVQMHLTLTPETLAPVETANVIADWKGTEHPEQTVIVSGHLDSWDLATGAIDDGAGIVVSMQAIHLLQRLGIHPKRTVRLVAWMDEEQGSTARRPMPRITRAICRTMSVRSSRIWVRDIRPGFTSRAERRWMSG